MTDDEIERLLASLPPAEPPASLDRRMERLFAQPRVVRPRRAAPWLLALAAAGIVMAALVARPRPVAPTPVPAQPSAPAVPIAAVRDPAPAWWVERHATWTGVSADGIVLIGDQPYRRLRVEQAFSGSALLDRGRADGVATRTSVVFLPCRTE